MRNRVVLLWVIAACRPDADAPTTAPPSKREPAEPLSGLWPEPAPEKAPTVEPVAAKDPERELERAAAKLVQTPKCAEIASNTSGLYSKIKLHFEVAATGEVGKIDAQHAPDRKKIADCYVAQLKGHRFERTDGGDAVEVDLELPWGAMDKDIIRRVVRGNLEQVRACYNEGLARNREAKGRVTITFTIGPTGAVSAAAVESNDTGDAKIGECIATAMKGWKFPEPEGGGNIVVTYPFVLEAG